MRMTQFGDFGDFCRDSNIVVCNLFRNRGPQSCTLEGFVATDGHRVANLGNFLALQNGGLWTEMYRGYTALWDCVGGDDISFHIDRETKSGSRYSRSFGWRN